MFKIGDLVFVKELQDEKVVVNRYKKRDGKPVYEVEGSLNAFYDEDLLMVEESKGTEKKNFDDAPSTEIPGRTDGEHQYDDDVNEDALNEEKAMTVTPEEYDIEKDDRDDEVKEFIQNENDNQVSIGYRYFESLKHDSDILSKVKAVIGKE